MAAVMALTTMGGVDQVHAAFDENLKMYTLDTVVVEADRTKNKFGDTITEQSYYRTGGDVKVITREEIEKRHYTDLTEAIKRIPGVTFQNPGYRGGEYGYQFYNNGVSINGDTRVIILVDGRRVDNAASSRIDSSSTSGSKSTGVNLDQVTNMENVDKIEVIKGPGASVYGADATGGVINIITRKGGTKDVGTLDLSTGSWDKHNYAFSYSGSAGDDQSFHYFISANRNMSGDTKYKDSFTGTNGTLTGSRWKEDGVNFRIDKDFSENHNLKIWYNFKEGKDGYPIAVPNQKYMNESDWKRIIFAATVGPVNAQNQLYGPVPTVEELSKLPGKQNDYYKISRGQVVYKNLAGDANNPGYHNLYALDGNYRSFSRFKNNDWDVVYTFNKENGMESFVRFYDQNHRYSNRDFYRWGRTDAGKFQNSMWQEYNTWSQQFANGPSDTQVNDWIEKHLAPFVGDKESLKKWIEESGGYASEPTSWNDEKNRGFQLQWAKSLGNHDIIANFLYDQAKNYSRSINSDGTIDSSYVKRKTWTGYIQDKIHVTDKWDITPALRYSKYSSFEHSTGDTQGSGSTHALTYAVNSEYMFNDSASMYLGWTHIFRPLREGDYTTTDYVLNTPLEDEKGDAYTVGVRKDITDKTTVAVHYDWTRMSNAIATLPVWTGSDFKSEPLNAKEDKKSFNITVDHQFNDHLMLSASYSHMNDKWMAKNGAVIGDYNNTSDINTAINDLRPQNHYSLNLSYENGKLYTGLLTNWYTGCSEYAFTSRRFLVLDWNLNYAFTPNVTGYVVVTNLTNEAYETSFNSWNGVGSSAMPGRAIMVGAKYTF